MSPSVINYLTSKKCIDQLYLLHLHRIQNRPLLGARVIFGQLRPISHRHCHRFYLHAAKSNQYQRNT